MAHTVKKGRLTLTARKNLIGLWFVLPFVVGLILFFIPALVQAVRFGFSEIRYFPDRPAELTFIGLDKYRHMLFVDPTFVRSIAESIGSLILNMVIILLYALLIAIVLNKDMKGKGIFRAILFLPVIISTGIIARIDASNVLTSTTGGILGDRPQQIAGGMFSGFDVTQLILEMNLNVGLVDVVMGAVDNLYTIITRSGVQMLIFLAGLQAISPSIYESARVEGATWWESLWKITIPMISPLILVNAVYTVVDAFTAAGNPVMDRIYEVVKTDYSTASVMSILYFLVAGVILVLTMLIVSRMTFYETDK